ncbi:MAG: hypothetical protein PF541_15290 [Prolixibacteraceae bacterium]|jgi:hypothetical protein|nr:hypothetical protein [Prolixibacteraceae bacterium]
MKKILTILTALLISIGINAQNDKKYGPVAGNYGVGIAASPVLEYVGNFFGKTTFNSAPTFNLPRYSLAGKYFIKDNNAIRAGIGFSSHNVTSYFGIDDKNKKMESGLGLILGIGLEKRFGLERIQAYYGPSVGLSFVNNVDKYIYADGASTGDILKDNDTGVSFTLGLGGFAGIEYFLTKNIALGTEIGLGLNIESKGKEVKEYQGSPDVEDGSKFTSLIFGFQAVPAQLASTGKLFFMFYF